MPVPASEPSPSDAPDESAVPARTSERRPFEWPAGGLLEVRELLKKAAERYPSNSDVAAASRSADVAGAFFTEAFRDIGWPPDNLGPYLKPLPGVVRRLQIAAVAANTGEHLSQGVVSDLRSAARDLDRGFSELLARARQWLQTKVEPERAGKGIALVDRYAELTESRRITEQAREVRDQVVEVLDETRRAAGVTAETGLAVHFKDYANRQHSQANGYRGATIAVLLLITGIAALLLFGERAEDFDTAEELAKLSITVPLAALAAYLGREASRHRSRGEWAREMQIRLLTFDAFTEPMSPESREAMRVEFGRRVFSHTGDVASLVDADNAPSAFADATALVRGVAELARSSPAPAPPRNTDKAGAGQPTASE